MKKSMDNSNLHLKTKQLLLYLNSVQMDTKVKETCQSYLHFQKEILTFFFKQNPIQVKQFSTDLQVTQTLFILILTLQLFKNFQNLSFMVIFIWFIGLATKGIIARTLVENLLDNDPTKLKSIHCRFAGHVFPGESF